MTDRLENQTGLITGAAAGIGRATAIDAAEEGASLFVADIDKARVEETASMIEENDGSAIPCEVDVSDPESVESLFETIESEETELDFAFNNAGIEGPQAQSHEVEIQDWQKTIGINLTGTWLCMRHELEMMSQQDSDSAIVNMSSIAGLKGFAGLSTYTASKHGVIGLTKSTALEYAQQNIRVNAICPGVIETEMIDRVTGNDQEAKEQFLAMEPIGRLGTPDEIAEAVIWLSSDRSSFVTGEYLVADGGIMAS